MKSIRINKNVRNLVTSASNASKKDGPTILPEATSTKYAVSNALPGRRL